MKRKNPAQFILIVLFLILTVLIIVFRKKDNYKYGIEIRRGGNASSEEWVNTKAAIESLIDRVSNNPADLKAQNALGMAYLQEGRISGNHTYYDASALHAFDEVLKKDTSDFEALVGKATVQLSQHHFQDALETGRHAEMNSVNSSSVYGILTDSYVELGNYKKAIEMGDKMASTRPDLRSYSRISYLREIIGDYPGAIDAMKMAVEAGYPGFEQTEWCRCQLGHLYENTGNIREAINCYDAAIYYRPAFAFAYAGKGRVEKTLKNYPEAISYFKQAQVLIDDFSFQQELTEIYRITNQQQLAANSARRTLELLSGKTGNESETVHGHYADKELAYAYLDSYDYLNAYKHAMIEYNRRPENIDINMALGWVNYKLGRYADADKYADVALSTKSKNPAMNFEAGLIKMKVGKMQQGKKLIQSAELTGGYISPLLKWEEKRILNGV